MFRPGGPVAQRIQPGAVFPAANAVHQLLANKCMESAIDRDGVRRFFHARKDLSNAQRPAAARQHAHHPQTNRRSPQPAPLQSFFNRWIGLMLHKGIIA